MKNSIKAFVVALVCFVFLLSRQGLAASIAVSYGSDDYLQNGNCSLREAIAVANYNNQDLFPECVFDGDFGDDTITLVSGQTYNLSIADSTHGIEDGDLNISENLIVTVDGANYAILDLVGLSNSRAFVVLSSVSLSLNGLQIQNGTFTSSTSDEEGGLIYAAASTSLSITGCAFSNHTININASSSITGGVIFGYTDSIITIQDSTFSSNSVNSDAASDGAIYGGLITTNGAAQISVGNTVFESNSIDSQAGMLIGGLLYFYDSSGTSDVSITEVTIQNNSVDTTSGLILGGLLAEQDSSIDFQKNLMSQNTINSDSGDIAGAIIWGYASTQNSAFHILNSTLAFNSSITTGDIQGLVRTSTLGVSNFEFYVSFNTFAHNSLGDENTNQVFSSVFDTSIADSALNQFDVKSNVFFDNTAQYGAVVIESLCTREGASLIPESLGYNVRDVSFSCDMITHETDVINDPALDSLGANGGPTETMAISNLSVAYNLNPDCTDARGSDSFAVTDQRGAPRNDDSCDSGAYEFSYFYTDADGDGYGTTASQTQEYLEESATRDGDCDDDDSNIHPTADDLCDGIDNDCNAVVDDDFVDDLDLACVVGVGACERTGVLVCNESGLSTTCSVVPAEADSANEVDCTDSIDNDCDGLTDSDDSDCPAGDDDTTGDDDDDDDAGDDTNASSDSSVSGCALSSAEPYAETTMGGLFLSAVGMLLLLFKMRRQI